MIPVESSLIKAIGYDKETEKLTVEFKRGGQYSYYGVSPETYDNFRQAESIGKFFLMEIKGLFPFEINSV